jgi:diguanylate cyclase (GGDEF)-like protein
VTASAGIAELRPDEEIPDLIRRADSALYDSKKAGRNCGHWHDGSRSYKFKAPAGAAAAAEVLTPAAPVKESIPSPVPAVESTSADVARDAITGLPNRSMYCEDVARRVAERKRGGPAVSAIFVRIDRYEELVAKQGAGAEEVVLRAVTQFLRATMRDMDHVARYDEDVFALLLPGTELDSAAQVAQRLRRAIERCRLTLAEQPCQFTVSAGVAEASRSDNAERLLEVTDLALKAAVTSGGNNTFVFTGKQVEPAAAEVSSGV